MKRAKAVSVILAAGMSLAAAAQNPAATAAGSTPAPKVGIIQFQAAVTATNEFQRDVAALQKKFQPQRDQLKSLSDEIDALSKQLQSQGATLSDADRTAKGRQLDEKQKQAQRLADDAQNDYSQQLQDVFSRVAQKVDQLVLDYSKQQGFTVVIDGGATGQQDQTPMVLYWAPSTDISKTIVDAYNTKSGVPAPPPETPSAPAPAPAAPR
ncbi:OmpH family outer membrane protein [Occallatibacter riparius]|uniref:OmpH family outer membrane protein n=1 Tax=Occallatibacter riparius TaxID=1002689 RepID=A0A9J7BMW8_9BACT|nr:OmpH family outer membrane protein [Occallatibacter riparius]UWZ82525.1 OmpH family outer membrane protein [Occallatibacter riparius]